MWTKKTIKNLNSNNSFTLNTIPSLWENKSPQSQKTNSKLGKNICNSYRQTTVSLIYYEPLEFNKKNQQPKKNRQKSLTDISHKDNVNGS